MALWGTAGIGQGSVAGSGVGSGTEGVLIDSGMGETLGTHSRSGQAPHLDCWHCLDLLCSVTCVLCLRPRPLSPGSWSPCKRKRGNTSACRWHAQPWASSADNREAGML